MINKLIVCIFLFVFVMSSCNRKPETHAIEKTTANSIASIKFEIITSYPHDTNSFTEGLLIHDGKLYESTGATKRLPQTRSLFGIVDLKTGTIEPKAELDREKYFGEGITFLNGKVYQLTYDTKIGFVYDAVSFKKIREFTLPTKEGWGMTTDGKNLIMSDGTNVLTFLDPESLMCVGTVKVSENGYATDDLNELEYIDGNLYANIWRTNKIVKIDLSTGNVTGELDLNSLAGEAGFIYHGSLEMNGIAYDSAVKKVFITGKMWPKIYEISIND